jgi:anti-anti-sigma regulatory factor
MLKITEDIESENTVRLRLDGTMSIDSFGELANIYTAHRDSIGRTVILDMAGVDFMNDQAASRLIGLCNEGLRIINCSPFIATLLDTISKNQFDKIPK